MCDDIDYASSETHSFIINAQVMVAKVNLDKEDDFFVPSNINFLP